MSPEAATLRGFEWASEEVGKRHKLGGEPDWVQADETPVCRDCGERMTFYGQLDSINDDYALADCGLVFVFVCFNDFQAQAVVQSA